MSTTEDKPASSSTQFSPTVEEEENAHVWFAGPGTGWKGIEAGIQKLQCVRSGLQSDLEAGEKSVAAIDEMLHVFHTTLTLWDTLPGSYRRCKPDTFDISHGVLIAEDWILQSQAAAEWEKDALLESNRGLYAKLGVVQSALEAI